MNGARKSALLLHGLDEDDRAWVMSQLAPERRGALLPLLAELRALNIPCDAGLAKSAGAASQQAPAALAAEPAWALGAVLAARDWPWRHALLAGMDPLRRAAVERAAQRQLAPRTRAALVQQVLACAVGEPAPAAAPQRPLARLADKVRAWLK